MEQALDILVLRDFLTRDGAHFAIIEPEIAAYYANTIADHLDAGLRARLPENVISGS